MLLLRLLPRRKLSSRLVPLGLSGPKRPCLPRNFVSRGSQKKGTALLARHKGANEGSAFAFNVAGVCLTTASARHLLLGRNACPRKPSSLSFSVSSVPVCSLCMS